MGDRTGIAWCDRTWSPWVGCTRVSPACDHCYAEAWARRTGSPELWNGARRLTSDEYWKKPTRWNRAAGAAGRRTSVFPSLCDPFDNQARPEWRAAMWHTIRDTPNLDWLLLTKRPQNIQKMLPVTWGDGWPNVWLGATVENTMEQRRIAHLRAVPAVLRFLSCEPLLEPIEPDLRGIHWVICGGESGYAARPMSMMAASSLMAQCHAAGVAFFFKQVGHAHRGNVSWARNGFRMSGPGDDPSQWPEEWRVQEFPTVQERAAC